MSEALTLTAGDFVRHLRGYGSSVPVRINGYDGPAEIDFLDGAVVIDFTLQPPEVENEARTEAQIPPQAPEDEAQSPPEGRPA